MAYRRQFALPARKQCGRSGDRLAPSDRRTRNPAPLTPRSPERMRPGCGSLDREDRKWRLVVRHLLLVNAILLCACASQPPSAVQTPPASASSSFLAGDIPTPIQPKGGAQAASVPTPQRPPPTAVDARDAATPNEGDAMVAQLRTLSIEEADSGRVCESVERPGSRMTRTVCYTREERLANAAARDEQRDEQLDELQREQRWRDEIIRQAEMSGRRPSGFGLGPN